MDGKRRLWQAVASARRSLLLEQLLIRLQLGLLYAVLSITVIYLASRFFVLPYYSRMAFIAGTVFFIGHLVVALVKRPRRKEALIRLDEFYPHNELLTVLTAKEQSPLIQALLGTVKSQIGQVQAAFKKREKHLLQKRAVMYSAGTLLLLLLLMVFPAASQQEAKEIEADRAITQQLKKDVQKQVVKPIPEEAKKQLAELQQALENVKTSDEALKQLVKTQKEMAKLQHDLNAEMLSPDAELQNQLTALQEANKQLADTASAAQSGLSALGKPVDLNIQKSIARMNQQNAGNADGSQGNGNTGNTASSSSSSSQSGQSKTGQSSANAGQSNGQNGQTQNGQTPSNQGAENSSGSGQGQGNSQGQGSGTGSGQSAGNGSSQGGLQGGTGSGGRDLLAIPQRVGEANTTTIDSGIQNDGETVKEKGPVPATKGDVRPYADVVGTYEESYRQSTERLQLPQDLQQMVQSYFTSIE